MFSSIDIFLKETDILNITLLSRHGKFSGFRFLFAFKGFYAIEIFKSVKKFQILGPKNETLSEP